MRWTPAFAVGLLGLVPWGLDPTPSSPLLQRRACGKEARDAEGKAPDEEVFQRSVRPVLARRCKPCHEPGGVMYGRIPFDDPKAVRAHREGVLRRLKVPEEREAFLAWARSER